AAEGPLLVLNEPVSFWGGVDPVSGRIRDAHHAQAGKVVTGTVLVMSGGRGSSSASTVLAEMIRTGTAPGAIVLGRPDAIVVLGAVVAAELYHLVMPIIMVPTGDLATLMSGEKARVAEDARLFVG
ncbi:MAG: aconitase X swivel domain-containing protein, partial [Acidimicrobiia bacterium]